MGMRALARGPVGRGAGSVAHAGTDGWGPRAVEAGPGPPRLRLVAGCRHLPGPGPRGLGCLLGVAGAVQPAEGAEPKGLTPLLPGEEGTSFQGADLPQADKP